ncbi:RepA protein [Modicisalibacter xianhensis]|uniref:RepA protein n=2 Tax=Modicisalibacter xianhensis TaxID=442341 RepID=A0A4R8FA70_9GAMM|nr:RepA protein [Halomonas xianhensis]
MEQQQTTDMSPEAQAYRQELIAKGLDPLTAQEVVARLVRAGDLPSAQIHPVSSVQEEPVSAPLTRQQQELLRRSLNIERHVPSGDQLAFMHTDMCQVGLPRSRVEGLEFERVCGGVGLFVRAGKTWDGQSFVQQPIPYGPMPRLVMAYLNTQALRQRSAEIEVGNSASDFMRQLGIEPSGGKRGTYTTFRNQVLALSVCHITVGRTVGALAYTYDGKPIKQLEAWIEPASQHQRSLWPGVITFSADYFQALSEHAVPLDLRALQALRGSALAMDLYTMLAERLHRIEGRPIKLCWINLREQFGQEYRGEGAERNFKRKFKEALSKVLKVYPKARVQVVATGVMLKSSPPPVPYKE